MIWYLAAKHRRRVRGALAVVAGFVGLVLLNWLHIKMGEWTEGEIFVPVLQTITYPYSVLVVVVGVFIVCIPREGGPLCVGCRYSLSGLAAVDGVLVCPECGAKNPTRSAFRKSGADREDFSSDDSRRKKPRHTADAGVRSASRGAPEPAGAQDQQRHAPDEPPAEQAQHAR